MQIDPYFVKRLRKTHPKRLFYTLWARLADLYSCVFFDEYQIQWKELQCRLPPTPVAEWIETQVQPRQATYLLWALQATDTLDGCVVEVGAWRGVTTAYLAQATKAQVIAIDPFIGDTNEANFRAFQSRIQGYENVHFIRQPFGASARDWKYGPVRFIFVMLHMIMRT